MNKRSAKDRQNRKVLVCLWCFLLQKERTDDKLRKKRLFEGEKEYDKARQPRVKILEVNE